MKLTHLLLFFTITLFACQHADDKASSTSNTIYSTTVTKDSTTATVVVPAKPHEDETWAGTINGKIAISLHIYKHDSLIYGEVTYKKSGKPINVLGTITKKGEYYFNEYYKTADITGIYFLEKDNDSTLTGEWNTAGTDYKTYKVLLKKQTDTDTPAPTLEKVDGEYGFSYGDPGSGSLFIKELAGDSIQFLFQCAGPAPGYNLATIMDKGTITNNTMTFSIKNEGSENPCGIIIKFVPGGAIVMQSGDSMDCGFGNNATVEGYYNKLNSTTPNFLKLQNEMMY